MFQPQVNERRCIATALRCTPLRISGITSHEDDTLQQQAKRLAALDDDGFQEAVTLIITEAMRLAEQVKGEEEEGGEEKEEERKQTRERLASCLLVADAAAARLLRADVVAHAQQAQRERKEAERVGGRRQDAKQRQKQKQEDDTLDRLVSSLHSLPRVDLSSVAWHGAVPYNRDIIRDLLLFPPTQPKAQTLIHLFAKALPLKGWTRKAQAIFQRTNNSGTGGGRGGGAVAQIANDYLLCSLLGNYPHCDQRYAVDYPSRVLLQLAFHGAHRATHVTAKEALSSNRLRTRFVKQLSRLYVSAIREYMVHIIDGDPLLLKYAHGTFDYTLFRDTVIETMDRCRQLIFEDLSRGEEGGSALLRPYRHACVSSRDTDITRCDDKAIVQAVQEEEKKREEEEEEEEEDGDDNDQSSAFFEKVNQVITETHKRIQTAGFARPKQSPATILALFKGQLPPHPVKRTKATAAAASGGDCNEGDGEEEEAGEADEEGGEGEEEEEEEKEQKIEKKLWGALDKSIALTTDAVKGVSASLMHGSTPPNYEKLIKGLFPDPQDAGDADANDVIPGYHVSAQHSRAIQDLANRMSVAGKSSLDYLLAVAALLPAMGCSHEAPARIKRLLDALKAETQTKTQRFNYVQALRSAFPYSYNLLQLAIHWWKQTQQNRYGPLSYGYVVDQLDARVRRPAELSRVLHCVCCHTVYSLHTAFRSNYKHAYGVGYRDLTVDLMTGRSACQKGKRNGHLRCGESSMQWTPMIGRFFTAKGSVFILCPQPGCTRLMLYDGQHHMWNEHGVGCVECTYSYMDKIIERQGLPPIRRPPKQRTAARSERKKGAKGGEEQKKKRKEGEEGGEKDGEETDTDAETGDKKVAAAEYRCFVCDKPSHEPSDVYLYAHETTLCPHHHQQDLLAFLRREQSSAASDEPFDPRHQAEIRAHILAFKNARAQSGRAASASGTRAAATKKTTKKRQRVKK